MLELKMEKEKLIVRAIDSFYQSKQGNTVVAAAVTVVFRKTLSSIGSKTGSRQIHNS
jgi:hypothetical protein